MCACEGRERGVGVGEHKCSQQHGGWQCGALPQCNKNNSDTLKWRGKVSRVQSTSVHPPQYQSTTQSKGVFSLCSLPFTIATHSHASSILSAQAQSHPHPNPHTALTPAPAACCCSSAPLQSPLLLLPQSRCNEGCAHHNDKSNRETQGLVGSVSHCVHV